MFVYIETKGCTFDLELVCTPNGQRYDILSFAKILAFMKWPKRDGGQWEVVDGILRGVRLKRNLGLCFNICVLYLIKFVFL